MSDVIEQPGQSGTETQVTEDDLRRMLADANKQRDDVTRERDVERAARTNAESLVTAERNARLLTEHERDANAGRVLSEAEQKYNAQKDAVKSGIAAQTGIATQAEDALARHMEVGDHKAAAASQRQLASAEAELNALRRQEAYLETNKEKFVQPVVKPPVREVRAAPQADRLNEVVSDLLPTERKWLETRPQFLTDPNYQVSVFDASRIASRKFARGSDPYIKEIERILGESAEASPSPPAPAPTRERAPSADIAPQRRAAPGQQPQGSQEWTLTPEMVEAADGIYGQLNSDNYISDKAERYKHYHNMRMKQVAAGRLSA